LIYASAGTSQFDRPGVVLEASDRRLALLRVRSPWWPRQTDIWRANPARGDFVDWISWSAIGFYVVAVAVVCIIVSLAWDLAGHSID
jgi:hypothetical protein